MTAGAPVRTETLMGTFVSIQCAGPDDVRNAAVDRALAWFHDIERRCTRFDPASELMQLSKQAGVAVPVSDTIFEALQFALALGEETGGAFDPTVGAAMEARGFNREHRSGREIRSAVAAAGAASYRDVTLDAARRTVTLARPLVLDLGAVVKGLAIDLAVRELRSFKNFAIDAGGDLYLGGVNPNGTPWTVGIRHPRRDSEVIESVQVSDLAVCTSGDYERRGDAGDAHILDPRSGGSAESLASVTVVAPTAMLADALATAAFVLGAERGLELLERMNVQGVLYSPQLDRHTTRGWP